MIFTSQQPRISGKTCPSPTLHEIPADRSRGLLVPENVTIWDWLFLSPSSASSSTSPAGFTNAATGERISYDELKDHATCISTALTQKFGFGEGQTVALFSPNTVWYPVAMFATTRVGTRLSSFYCLSLTG